MSSAAALLLLDYRVWKRNSRREGWLKQFLLMMSGLTHE